MIGGLAVQTILQETLRVSLNEEQQAALELALEETKPLLITGSAGTGKSFVLRSLVERLRDSEKSLVVAAPTGLAAMNVDGVTLHSLFNLPVGRPLYGKEFGSKARDFFSGLDFLIIDEISMVRVDVMYTIDMALRSHRESDEPFGGIKLVMFGDPYQLPPVFKWSEIKTRRDPHGNEWRRFYENRSLFFFEAPGFQKDNLRVIELQTIVRQESTEFSNTLNKVRLGIQGPSEELYLNNSSNQGKPPSDTLRLFGKKEPANHYNEKMLHSEPHKRIKCFKAKWKSNPELEGRKIRFASGLNFATEPEDSSEIPYDLCLRKGAKVIFTKNDDQVETPSQRRWSNGSTGTVVGIFGDTGPIVVSLDSNGKTVQVQRSRFEHRELVQETGKDGKVTQYTEVTGWLMQFPIRLGWAVTVHKSQGMTLDSVVLDFNDQYFEKGQAYVALSRVRSLEGLYFETPFGSNDVVFPDGKVRTFMLKAEKYPYKPASASYDPLEEIATQLLDRFAELDIDFSLGLDSFVFWMKDNNKSAKEMERLFHANRQDRKKMEKLARVLTSEILHL